MRIIITGGRDREDIVSVAMEIRRVATIEGEPTRLSDITIVEGCCPTGIDLDARRLAENNGMIHHTYTADWKQYGKAAGQRRNEQMAEAGADVCLAFPSAGKSAGTWDMIQRAVNHGIKTIIIPEGTK